MISYSSHSFTNGGFDEDDTFEAPKSRKQDYSRNRSYKQRRRPKRKADQPGVGIAGRNNRRRQIV